MFGAKLPFPSGSRDHLWFYYTNNNRTFMLDGQGVTAEVVEPDIGATNGVIHVIDRILGVPQHTIGEKLAMDPIGSHIIRSLGSASSEVIHTTSGGLKDILSSITNGILIWIFILAIGLFLLLKFVPMSPFAITNALQRTDNKQIFPSPPKQQVQKKQDNNYIDHSTYMENQKNQPFPTSQSKPTNTVTSLYPTSTPYSYHPEHRPTSRNITNDNNHTSALKQNNQKETESAPMLPKRKKQRYP